MKNKDGGSVTDWRKLRRQDNHTFLIPTECEMMKVHLC